MGSPISSQFPNAPLAGANTAAPAPTPKAQPVAKAEDDIVELTLSQRIYQLHAQGQKVSQIATALNLTEAAVNRYLNIPAKG